MFDVFLSPPFIEMVLFSLFTAAATTLLGLLFLSIQTTKRAYTLYVFELEKGSYFEEHPEDDSFEYVTCLAYKIRTYLFASFFLALLTFILHFPVFRTLSNILSSPAFPFVSLSTFLFGLLAGSILLLKFKSTVDRVFDAALLNVLKAQKKNRAG